MAAAPQNQTEVEASSDTPNPAVHVSTNNTIINNHHHINNPSLSSATPTSDSVNFNHDHHNIGIDDDDEVEKATKNNNAVDLDQDYFNAFPPGYRFCPLDTELIVCYLQKKIADEPLPKHQIRELNLYRYSPDYISGRYPSIGENQWYFFTPREKKYKNGSRPNRAAGNGYWKATGSDRPIKSGGVVVGYKKVLVYYRGRPPNGKKSDWIMNEYRLPENHKSDDADEMRLDDYVLCKIHHKINKSVKSQQRNDEPDQQGEPGGENGSCSSSVPSARSNEQNAYPYAIQEPPSKENCSCCLSDPPARSNANQANNAYSSLGSVLQYPASVSESESEMDSTHMNMFQPSVFGATTDLDTFNHSDFPSQYFHHEASFMHQDMYTPPPGNAQGTISSFWHQYGFSSVNAQGSMYLREYTLASKPEGGHIDDMLAQDNSDAMDPYIGLANLSSYGLESPVKPQYPSTKKDHRS